MINTSELPLSLLVSIKKGNLGWGEGVCCGVVGVLNSDSSGKKGSWDNVSWCVLLQFLTVPHLSALKRQSLTKSIASDKRGQS